MQERNMPPFAPVLMQSTRAIGYSLEAAIADIIDNSIAAKAGKVQLSFFPVGDAYVSILDNGTGMDDAQMNIAMQYGSKSPTETRDSSDLGRYGLGLKTASLSQCRVLTVISKQGDQVIGRRWDLDYVIKTGAWSLLILDKEDFEADGEKYVQIDTYGRIGRENPEKISQSFQFDRATAEFLVNLLREEFGLQ